MLGGSDAQILKTIFQNFIFRISEKEPWASGHYLGQAKLGKSSLFETGLTKDPGPWSGTQAPGQSQAVLSLSTVGLHLPARVFPGLGVLGEWEDRVLGSTRCLGLGLKSPRLEVAVGTATRGYPHPLRLFTAVPNGLPTLALGPGSCFCVFIVPVWCKDGGGEGGGGGRAGHLSESSRGEWGPLSTWPQEDGTEGLALLFPMTVASLFAPFLRLKWETSACFGESS